MVEAAPAPSFKMSQPDLLLEFLIVAFDPPSQLGNVDELTERDVFRKRRQPIFDRLLLGGGWVRPFSLTLLRATIGLIVRWPSPVPGMAIATLTAYRPEDSALIETQ